MFEIKSNKDYQNGDFEYPYFLVQNGEEIEFACAGVRKLPISGDEGGFEIEAFGEECKRLSNYSINEFYIASRLSFVDWKTFDDFQLNISIWMGMESDTSQIDFKILPNFAFWNRPYSFAEYSEVFHKILRNAFSNWDFSVSNNKYSEFSYIDLFLFHNFDEKTINENLSKYENILYSVHENTTKELIKAYFDNLVIASFQFPEELKVPCEQYLLYFAQFLQDLGINATSNLKEEAGKVLFSVTPIDVVEALDKIREALAVYLSLPSSPVIYNNSFKSMQLKQQVENLQHSQSMKEMEMRSAQYALRLAQESIENQDKIIIRQNSFIDNQNKIIEKITSKSIMIDSIENKEELEKFCEGFEIGKSEFLIKQFGLHLNPAAFLKNAVNKILGKEKEESILGLNDEE